MKKIKVQRISLARCPHNNPNSVAIPALLILIPLVFESIMYSREIFTIQDPLYWIILRVLIYSFFVILSYKKLKFYKNIFLEIDENNIIIPKEVMRKKPIKILKEDIKEIFISRPKYLFLTKDPKIGNIIFILKNDNSYLLRKKSLDFNKLYQELKILNYEKYFNETSDYAKISEKILKFAYSTIKEKDSK